MLTAICIYCIILYMYLQIMLVWETVENGNIRFKLCHYSLDHNDSECVIAQFLSSRTVASDKQTGALASIIVSCLSHTFFWRPHGPD